MLAHAQPFWEIRGWLRTYVKFRVKGSKHVHMRNHLENVVGDRVRIPWPTIWRKSIHAGLGLGPSLTLTLTLCLAISSDSAILDFLGAASINCWLLIGCPFVYRCDVILNVFLFTVVPSFVYSDGVTKPLLIHRFVYVDDVTDDVICTTCPLCMT